MNFSTGIPSLDIISGVVICMLVLHFIRSRRLPKGLRLPPGPPGKFIVGNLAGLRKGYLWDTANRWAKEYGDLVCIKLLGQTIVFVNSPVIVRDLLEKRSSIYSDRVPLPMVHLMGWGWNTVVMPYGDVWRRHRKILHEYLRPEAVVKYQGVQTRQTRNFLRTLYESPEDFMHHTRHLAGAIIMEITYGIKVLPRDDPYLENAEAVLVATGEAAVPGKFLVNVLPFLQHVPAWMPGAGFRRKAREWEVIIRKTVDMPFNATKDALQAGTAASSFVGTSLENLSNEPDASQDEISTIRSVASVFYAAGAETTVSVLNTFILAMLVHPHVQRKAQAELDSVVGDRLPTFDDEKNLPYIIAVCKEVHRWHPSFPLGVGHRLMEDDVYGDYFFPAGSIFIGNAWTILHDEKLYGPNPWDFEPERFLKPGSIDPMLQFGFGRRVCPGRHMADNSIFIAVASILKVFDILPARDTQGNEIPVKATFTPGLVTHPEPFPCMIKPRSESARVLLLGLDDD